MLEVRTELTLLALDALIFAICVFAVRCRRMRDGQQAWVVALLLQAAGWTLFALPLDPNLHGVSSLGVVLLSASCSAYIFSMYGFVHRKPSQGLLLLIPAALLASEILWTDSFHPRALAANLVIGLQLAICAWPLLRYAKDIPAQLRGVICAAFLLSAIVTLARFFELLLFPDQLPDLRVSEPINTGAFLINHADLLFGNLGVALLHRERTRVEADRLATRDPLTELLNRRSLTSLVGRELLRQKRRDGTLALLMIGIDDFPEINNRFGQLAGDRVLRQFSRLLSASLRGQDLAGRYSSAGFCVLLPETGQAGALALAERLREAVASADIGPDGVRYTVSLGIAESQPDETNAAVLQARADDALRQARHRAKTGDGSAR
jgi:diguanylate cyclase (GGDEF)-like protein